MSRVSWELWLFFPLPRGSESRSRAFSQQTGKITCCHPSVLAWPQPPSPMSLKGAWSPSTLIPTPSPTQAPVPRAHLPGASYMPSELEAQVSEPAPDQAELHFHPEKARHRLRGGKFAPTCEAVLQTLVQPSKGGQGPHYPRLWVRKRDPGRGR